MSFTDLAAVVGALAWIPPIFIAVRSWITKPKIRVITQPTPEIGFTTFGPILNLRIALTVTHRDIVVTGVQLQVTHESGESTSFSWRGIVQRMGTLTYPQVGAVPFEKELNVLAMKVSLKDVEERFIRFQSLDYVEHKAELEVITLKKLAHMRRATDFDGHAFLRCQEMNELYSYIKQTFSWKPGAYRMKVVLESPDAFTILDDEYTFSLTPLQVQTLSENLSRIEQFYANEVLPAKPDDQQAQIVWRWVYPDMQRVRER